MKYDYFVAGRWRNHTAIREVVEKIRETGKTAYCFLENEYDGDGIKFENSADADGEALIAATEHLEDWQTNPTFRKIFETDMQAQRDAEAFILTFPAGLAAHVELGAAYGMGKKCYGIGTPEKAETLYLAFDAMYPDVESFIAAQIKVGVMS
ncbi:hypothetical protein EYC59_01390 [Candidatus Saccharibacteria bacterium]|nr:MAG: hypothetical protein EYC59_01390 [Candidatus Saccharibacteria bacterium]